MTISFDGIRDAAWFKSSYSGANETECVETAPLRGRAAVRDSKDPGGPWLNFDARAWSCFVTAIGRASL
ncbi:DUF397 domain-containing protein [Streptomyces sp. NBC_01455]|uniref:DUF397 domain-containing protein n=1 Tax=Streptomyces sp. NBC_01455 TaxID=2903874 RepID=UPI002E322D72|nr:DUF397 domain-containing protein [Streptomyces sp. NBC_01455]